MWFILSFISNTLHEENWEICLWLNQCHKTGEHCLRRKHFQVVTNCFLVKQLSGGHWHSALLYVLWAWLHLVFKSTALGRCLSFLCHHFHRLVLLYMVSHQKKKGQLLERSQEQDLVQLGTEDLLPHTFKGSDFLSWTSGSTDTYFKKTTLLSTWIADV